MLSMDNWLHYNQCILKEGRLTHAEVETEEDDKEAFMKRIVAADPFERRLKPISQDKCIFFGILKFSYGFALFLGLEENRFWDSLCTPV